VNERLLGECEVSGDARRLPWRHFKFDENARQIRGEFATNRTHATNLVFNRACYT
jgi:hypothetical protein